MPCCAACLVPSLVCHQVWSEWASAALPRVLVDGVRSGCCYSTTVMPIERAVPSTIFIGGLDVVGVEVGHLGRRDLAHLVAVDPADLVGVRRRAALLQAGGLLDQLGGRRGLRDERERTVFVDRDLDRDHVAAHGLGGCVVRLAELHDVHAVRTEGGTDRRSRSRRAGLQLHLDEGGDLLLGRHCRVPCFVRFLGWLAAVLARLRRESSALRQTFWIWVKLSSTGVSRPKISTSALTRWASMLISVMVACRVANGPSTTMTESPA